MYIFSYDGLLFFGKFCEMYTCIYLCYILEDKHIRVSIFITLTNVSDKNILMK